MIGRSYFLSIALFFSLFVHAQEIVSPKGWEVIDKANGDLNNDGKAEKVVVYNTADSTDFGRHRELRIFKKMKGEWTIWETSATALLKSNEGGAMGEPFEGIEVKDNVLLIHHSGGSAWKWSYTDTYRFQNNQFELIGHSTVSGRPCMEWTSLDFNLSTGKIMYKKEFEDCETEEQVSKPEEELFYKKGISLTLKNRNPNEIEIVSPKLKYKFFL